MAPVAPLGYVTAVNWIRKFVTMPVESFVFFALGKFGLTRICRFSEIVYGDKACLIETGMRQFASLDSRPLDTC